MSSSQHLVVQVWGIPNTCAHSTCLTQNTQLKRLAVATVIALVLDLLWIGVVANRCGEWSILMTTALYAYHNSFYKNALGDLARTTPDGALAPLLVPALLVYALIPLGLTIFAIPRVLEVCTIVYKFQRVVNCACYRAAKIWSWAQHSGAPLLASCCMACMSSPTTAF